jgi:ParB family chromosome partitioning protein
MALTRIADINVGKRTRQKMGDLEGLAASIRARGLLQPIGITKDMRLVHGERRLRACRDILKWTEIEAAVIDLEGLDLLRAEHDENVMRKGFTLIEKVQISEAIKAGMGSKQGSRTDLNISNELQGVRPEVPKGRQTRDIVAKEAGFSSARSMEKAKAVLKYGDPETVDAVAAEQLTVDAAYNKVKGIPPRPSRSRSGKGKKMPSASRGRGLKEPRARKPAPPKTPQKEGPVDHLDRWMFFGSTLASKFPDESEVGNLLKMCAEQEYRPKRSVLKRLRNFIDQLDAGIAGVEMVEKEVAGIFAPATGSNNQPDEV